MERLSEVLIRNVCESAETAVKVSRMEGRIAAFREDLSFVRSMSKEYKEGDGKRILLTDIALTIQAAIRAQEREMGEDG